MADEQTQEEVKEEETSEETQPSTDEEQSDAQEGAEETSEESSSKDEDENLRQQLEKEQNRRQKAEKAAAERKYKEREQKRESEASEDYEESEDDRPVTLRDLERFKQDITKQQQEAQARELAKNLSSSEIEADLTLEYYNNRIVPTGDINEDMRLAYAMANAQKIQRTQEETKRAAASKESVQTADASGTRNKKSPEPRENENMAFLKRQGWQWDGSKQALIDPNGVMKYDPKTGQQSRI